jgi:hypothetical protein
MKMRRWTMQAAVRGQQTNLLACNSPRYTATDETFHVTQAVFPIDKSRKGTPETGIICLPETFEPNRCPVLSDRSNSRVE